MSQILVLLRNSGAPLSRSGAQGMPIPIPSIRKQRYSMEQVEGNSESPGEPLPPLGLKRCGEGSYKNLEAESLWAGDVDSLQRPPRDQAERYPNPLSLLVLPVSQTRPEGRESPWGSPGRQQTGAGWHESQIETDDRGFSQRAGHMIKDTKKKF